MPPRILVRPVQRHYDVTDVRTITIIPTYNERENACEIIECVLGAAPLTDILLVDDSSPDGTADLVGERFAGDRRVSVLKRTGTRGLGRSYVDGYLWALRNGYDRIAQMDADFSHDPKYLPTMLAEADGADVVIGSRYCEGGGVRNWPVRRQLLSRFANRYVAAVTRIPVRDATSGFRVHSRAALERMDVDQIVSNGYAFQVEMSYRAHARGLRIAESPIVFVDRTLGKSKMSGGVIWESVLMPWRLRFGRAAQPIPRSAL
jgi:dolichol-phosphate mannosyltransferase